MANRPRCFEELSIVSPELHSDTQLERVFQGTGGRSITVKVSVPVRTPDVADEWSCTYQIEGLESGKVRKSFGIDAIQAFFLALTYVSTSLYTSEEYERGELVWEGGLAGDLGLPIAAAVADMLRERRK
jgi:hypothetical protein